MQLLDSYRVIIETTTTLSNDGSTAQGRPSSVDAIQRMMQAAMFGSQMLGTATGPPPATVPVPESKLGGNVGAVGEETEGNPSKRQACFVIPSHLALSAHPLHLRAHTRAIVV